MASILVVLFFLAYLLPVPLFLIRLAWILRNPPED